MTSARPRDEIRSDMHLPFRHRVWLHMYRSGDTHTGPGFFNLLFGKAPYLPVVRPSRDSPAERRDRPLAAGGTVNFRLLQLLVRLSRGPFCFFRDMCVFRLFGGRCESGSLPYLVNLWGRLCVQSRELKHHTASTRQARAVFIHSFGSSCRELSSLNKLFISNVDLCSVVPSVRAVALDGDP